MNPPPRVLAVDDDKQFCELLSAWLSRSYEVEFAHDGDAGVKAARAERPDLILLDVMMPGLSGFSLAWVFKHDPFLAGVPVVFCTAHIGEIPDANQSLSKADGYLLKPFRLADLKSTMSRLLDSYEGPGALLRQAPRSTKSVSGSIQWGEEAFPATLGPLANWGALMTPEQKPAGELVGQTVEVRLSDPDLVIPARVLDEDDDGRHALRFRFTPETSEAWEGRLGNA